MFILDSGCSGVDYAPHVPNAPSTPGFPKIRRFQALSQLSDNSTAAAITIFLVSQPVCFEITTQWTFTGGDFQQPPQQNGANVVIHKMATFATPKNKSQQCNRTTPIFVKIWRSCMRGNRAKLLLDGVLQSCGGKDNFYDAIHEQTPLKR